MQAFDMKVYSVNNIRHFEKLIVMLFTAAGTNYFDCSFYCDM